nr:ABC transporter ATP-binding protein [Agrococcus sp. ARC_14]
MVVEFRTPRGIVRALDGASLTAEAGERLAIVGESGSGKSTVGAAIGALLPANGRFGDGTVRVDGVDVGALDRPGLRRLRRETLGFIPQDPIATLNPTMRVGRQLALVVRDLGGDTSGAALAQLLEEVQITDPADVLRRFPHQLSGGMAQRVAIAIAMVRRPRILIADEPTAALDANVRREVLKLVFEAAEHSGATVVWLSHDLDAVAKWCTRVAVMYRGQIVEDGPTADVLEDPTHPYTRSLLAAMPSRLQRGVEVRTYTELLAAQQVGRAADEESIA